MRPKPGFDIGNWNQCPILVSVSWLILSPKLFFFKIFKLSHVFLFLFFFKLKIEHRSSKTILKSWKFGRKLGSRGPFMIEKMPHTIGNKIFLLKYGFRISYRIGWKNKPIRVLVSVSDQTKIVVSVVHYSSVHGKKQTHRQKKLSIYWLLRRFWDSSK